MAILLFTLAVLLLYYVGTPSTVGSLTVVRSGQASLLLDWTAPPTLANNAEYCVDVVDLTSSSAVYSGCGITETEYTYFESPDISCHTYTFTVSAMNATWRGVGNTVVYGSLTSTQYHNKW